MSQPRTLFFEVYIDDQLVRTERLEQDVIKIGSHAKSHVFLDHPSVSRVHAYVEVSGNDVSIIDLGSGKGTFVNGEKVNKRSLQHRDTIGLGEVKLVFLTRDEKAEAAARAAAAAARQKEVYVPPADEVVYARRFLARPAQNDGAVELAVLFNDHVIFEDLWRPPADVIIGSSPKATLPIDHEALGTDEFPLIETGSGEPTISFTAAMSGEIYVGTERYTLEEAIASGRAKRNGNRATVPLTVDTRVRLAFGEILIFAHRSTKPALALPFSLGSDSPLAYYGLSIALHAALLGMMFFWPSQLRDPRLDSFDPNDRFVQILIQDAQVEEPPPPPADELAEEEEEEQTPGDEAAGDEGRAGEETAPDEDNRMAIEGDADPNQPIELARAQAMQEVQDRGALQVLNNLGPTSLFGDTAVGYDPITTMGGVSGDTLGASYGSRGLGRYGGGLGGGGRSMSGGFGSGPIAVSGRASGNTNLGRDQLQVREREVRTPTVELGSAEVRGQLDREIIQRVVREHRREVRACYEAELQRNPALEGRISIEWVISPSGSVEATRVENSTMNNAEVEGCLARRIRSWRFPEPRGGGTVRVTYPFVFTPGG